MVDLVDPNVSVVYIIPTMTPEASKFFDKALASIFKVFELLEQNRLLILEVPRPPHFKENVSLAKQLLCNPEKMAELVFFLSDNTAYMIPAVAGIDEIELCCVYTIKIRS
jgi:hypothetical protein